MRYIFFLRGLPSSGKTTFLKQKNLQTYTLSLDQFEKSNAPILDFEGRLRVDFNFDHEVDSSLQESHLETLYDKMFNLLKTKMKIGELIFIDLNNISDQYWDKYKKLIEFYRYQAFCLDFSNVDLETCKQRNQTRQDFKYISDQKMDELDVLMRANPIPGFLKVVQPDQLDDILAFPPFDASNYRKIHHFGDIQGCMKPLQQYFDDYPIQDDELYIFVGDYIDRGTENHLVVDFMLQNYHRPNFILLEGNHERHLWNWSLGLVAEHEEFQLKTKPQLDQANIPPKQVQDFILSLKNVAYYTFDQKTVVVSHGGVSAIPANFSFINSDQIIRGVGRYEQSEQSDDAFLKNTPEQTFSIHGHRNYYRRPPQINSKCFNLEGKVEFGGCLRVVRLDRDGFEIIEVQN